MKINQVASSILLATFLFTNVNYIYAYGDNYNNMRITARYHEVSDIHKTPHKGIDIALNKGTPIASFSDGIVESVKDFGNKGFGKVVYVRDSQGNILIYAHLSKIIAKEGDDIKFGEVIGLAGSTGRSTGSHLHFQVNIKGKDIDPLPYINKVMMRNALLEYTNRLK